jgi:hypothetical protein
MLFNQPHDKYCSSRTGIPNLLPIWKSCAAGSGALAEMRTLLLGTDHCLDRFTSWRSTDALAKQLRAYCFAVPVFIEQTLFCQKSTPCFYRITQESLNNVVKHAQAMVSVSLSATTRTSDTILPWSGEVRLLVLMMGWFPSWKKEQISWVWIMRERSASIGATLTVESQIGQGTIVTLTWSNPGAINFGGG